MDDRNKNITCLKLERTTAALCAACRRTAGEVGRFLVPRMAHCAHSGRGGHAISEPFQARVVQAIAPERKHGMWDVQHNV